MGSKSADGAVESFGAWRLRKGSSLVANAALIELRLTRQSLLMLGATGTKLGRWPIDQVGLDVFGNYDGVLRLGAESIEIKSAEKRQARQLRDAILARGRPTSAAVPMEPAETPALETAPPDESDAPVADSRAVLALVVMGAVAAVLGGFPALICLAAAVAIRVAFGVSWVRAGGLVAIGLIVLLAVVLMTHWDQVRTLGG